MRLTFAASLLCAGAAALWGDTLNLRNGQTVQGTYLGGSAREIRMDLGDRVQTYSLDQVASLQFDSGSAPANSPAPNASANTAPSASNAPPEPQQPQENAPANQANEAPPPGPSGFSLPSGTRIVVRMIDGVDSDDTRLGRTYKAALDEPVVINGQTVIPRGADATTKVVADQQSGKIEGRTAVALVLQTIFINGRPVDVSTEDVTERSGSRGARSGKVIGGTAALGAIIGAVAGGGKGAAIGAASGAAVGTGAQVLTHGQRVRIPAETRLTFTLTDPVNL